ncbi:PTTG1 protein, partial [Aegotheles bennettii]|nr:PTTG1 protein [Aegotheles bennettii]
MSTLIFIDQENGEVGATKNQLRLPSGSVKALSERTQVNTPLPKKTIGTSPAASHSVRKALGNVNRTGGVTSKVDKIREKNQPCTANKITEKTGLESCDAVAEEDWPEIENMFPYDPRAFESFDLDEEDKVSDIDLHVVPLMIFGRTYDRCVNMVPSPVKIEDISWESNLLQSTDFLATLDEIIDMPPPNYDL